MELKLFGRTLLKIGGPETKENSVAPYIYIMYRGNEFRGVAPTRNKAQYSEDAYKRCVIAYRAISMVAKACGGVPLVVKRKTKKPQKPISGETADVDSEDNKPQEGPKRRFKRDPFAIYCKSLNTQDEMEPVDPTHPLQALMDKPNPWETSSSFREAAISYLCLSGDTFIEGVGPSKSEPPMELWSHRVDRMRVIPGEHGPQGYCYECNGEVKRWSCDVNGAGPILHIKFFNPLSDWYGMSPIEAAAYSVDGHNMAGEWNQALLQNGARPSGALVYKPAETDPANLTDKQKEALKEQINGSYAGTRNAGRVPILDGRIEWMQMSMTPAEMDWIEGKRENAREIALAEGVPPMMLGIPGDNTYSNYQEARASFYQDTVLPLLGFYLDHLNRWLAPAFGEDIVITADIENLPALEPVRKSKWEAMETATWLTTNEKRMATGFEPREEKEADQILIPSTLVPLEGIMDPEPGALGPDGLPLPGGPPQLDEDGKPIKPKPGDKPKPGEEDPKKPGAGKPPFAKALLMAELYDAAKRLEAGLPDIGLMPPNQKTLVREAMSALSMANDTMTEKMVGDATRAVKYALDYKE